MIVHDIDFMNRRLSKAQYFFSDIKKEGICLYDSKQFQLKEAKELSNKERQKLAQEDFDYWLIKCKRIFNMILILLLIERVIAKAAFMLHQVTERLYTTILLVFTRYKPKSHDLAILRKFANTHG